MSKYLGDFTEDSTHYFAWDSNSGDGASITRATDGVVTIWKNGDSTDASTADLVDDEDEATGVHRCTLVLTDVFYAVNCDYTVVLLGAVIDGETVNAVIAEFSIENRFDEVIKAISAANLGKLEDILDGTGGTGMTLNKLTINGSDGNGVVDIDNANGAGVNVTGSTYGLYVTGTNDRGALMQGADGGLHLYAYTAGPGLECQATAGAGISALGQGGGAGISTTGGATGHGLYCLGGATSGDGIYAAGQTAGDGMTLVAAGANQYDLNADIHGTLDVCTTNTDMRGTDSVPINPMLDTEDGSSFTAIPKTGYKLASDGLDAVTTWTVDITGTVSGNSTHNAAAVVAALGTGSTLTACLTAAGFSTHSAADVWASAARTLTAFAFTPSLDAAYDAAKTAAQAGSAMALTAGERNAVAAALLALANGIETGVTLKQALQRIGAVAAGDMPTGASLGTETFRGLDGATDRVKVTVDDFGNRTMEYDP